MPAVIAEPGTAASRPLSKHPAWKRRLPMLRFIGGTVGVIFLIGLLVVVGLLALIF